MVLESGLLLEREEAVCVNRPTASTGHSPTLQDSLMARLDRLVPVKTLAQLGATVGREFAYALLRAVSPLAEAILQHGLGQLVEAEFLYQRGHLPQVTYLFKHVLIQDGGLSVVAAKHSATVSPARCPGVGGRVPETVEMQPELLAHHYRAAGRAAQAILYWQRAGLRASERSATLEAISHFTTGSRCCRLCQRRQNVPSDP